MGTSQIMMMILSVVLVAIAVAFAIMVFNNNAVNSNRQLVLNELNFLASQAYRFWRTPVSMGGASNDIGVEDQERLEFFLRWSGNTNATASGTYTIQVNEDGSINITGTGTEIGKDRQNPVQAILTITPDSSEMYSISIVN